MTVYEQQQAKKKDDSIKSLCLTLAKLLESKPSTVTDESRLATWAEQIDRYSGLLVGALGRNDGMSVMLRECAELIQNEPDVREFLKRMGCPVDEGRNPYTVLRNLASNIQSQRESEHQQATAVINDLHSRLGAVQHDFSKSLTSLEAMKTEVQAYRDAGVSLQEVEDMRADLAQWKNEKGKRRSRVKVDASTGIRVIDYGDDD